MKKKNGKGKILAILPALLLAFVGCQNNDTVSKEEYNTALLIAIWQEATSFPLAGTWETFTGDSTTTGGKLYYPSSRNEVILTDGVSSFGTYSSCSLLKSFTGDSFVTQNPENNGGCYSGDTSKGKYFKTVYFTHTDGKIYTCTLNGLNPALSQVEAEAIEDTSNRSDPGTGGCSGFSWSRIERVTDWRQ